VRRCRQGPRGCRSSPPASAPGRKTGTAGTIAIAAASSEGSEPNELTGEKRRGKKCESPSLCLFFISFDLLRNFSFSVFSARVRCVQKEWCVAPSHLGLCLFDNLRSKDIRKFQKCPTQKMLYTTSILELKA
jgi:hypothetical protein